MHPSRQSLSVSRRVDVHHRTPPQKRNQKVQPEMSHARYLAMQGQRTGAVLQALCTLSKKQTGNRGWQVINHIWGISQRDFDQAALAHFFMKDRCYQQHLLLAFASTDLGRVKNLSAFFFNFMSEHDLTDSFCLSHLAGCCPRGRKCHFSHVTLVNGWQVFFTTLFACCKLSGGSMPPPPLHF